MNRHTMIRKYRTSDLDREVFSDVTLRDLIFICCYVLVMRLPSFLVQINLRAAYTVFNLIAGLLLTRSIGKTNPPKRLRHLFMYRLCKLTDDLVYLPVERKDSGYDI